MTLTDLAKSLQDSLVTQKELVRQIERLRINNRILVAVLILVSVIVGVTSGTVFLAFKASNDAQSTVSTLEKVIEIQERDRTQFDLLTCRTRNTSTRAARQLSREGDLFLIENVIENVIANVSFPEDTIVQLEKVIQDSLDDLPTIDPELVDTDCNRDGRLDQLDYIILEDVNLSEGG